jgi:hypothetical protein
MNSKVLSSIQATQSQDTTIRDESNSWFKFDDSRITAFNSSDIPEECYGGRHEYDDNNSFDSGSRSKNAYMLVYDKVRKKPMML